MTIRLFELVDQMKALERLEDFDEVPPEVMRDTVEALEGDIEQKVIAVAKHILSAESTADSIIEASKTMAARGARAKKHVESMKAYLLFQLQAMNFRKIDAPDIVIARRANPVAVQVTDESAIPEAYWRQPEPPPKQVDKKLIKEALQNGAEIPGCYLESGESIRISV
jgi:Siphovirus Gp157